MAALPLALPPPLNTCHKTAAAAAISAVLQAKVFVIAVDSRLSFFLFFLFFLFTQGLQSTEEAEEAEEVGALFLLETKQVCLPPPLPPSTLVDAVVQSVLPVLSAAGLAI